MSSNNNSNSNTKDSKRLNKGLDAIFGGDITGIIEDIENNSKQNDQIEVELASIRPNPYQPRRFFDQEKLEELAESIKTHGIFTPVILKKSIQGYEIVAGERRTRAARMVGLTTVPAIIVYFSDDQMFEIALLENIQRENLNAIEEAQAYHSMMKRFNFTQEQLASRLGKSRTHIANLLRLLNLDSSLQNYVLEGKLTMGHVRPLVTLDKEKAIEIANKALEQKLSVREVENIVKGIELSQTKKNKPKKEVNQQYTYVEKLIRKKLRTMVKVEDKQITIRYQDTSDLNRILELMGMIEEE